MAKPNPRSRSEARRPPRRSPGPGVVLVRWLLLIAVGVGLAGILYGVHLDRVVRGKFEGKRWALPARVYARSLELYATRSLTPDQFQGELERLNYRALAENWDRIRDLRLEDGSRPDVVALPMPAPLYFAGDRLPASYANFYICNAAVLVPTFNDPQDRVALGILGELFRDRPVVGIHAVDLVLGFGTLHCLTQQQPA